GVGGLAASAAAYVRKVWGDVPRIVVVEPEVAPALIGSIAMGAVQAAQAPPAGSAPASAMGRLDCKEPSLIALKGLARDANDFMTITEAEGADAALAVAGVGLGSTPSGAAGIAGLLVAARDGGFGLTEASRVLVVLSEGPE
ncbi:MAG TPA: pyridoxal-phosphate dependent enzyme, partial [Roseibacterium sp.]|nr:pyridoxal-phosphate dependent enzyme [Roseibacterium sp.]